MENLELDQSKLNPAILKEMMEQTFKPNWIDPLDKMGFDFIGYGHVGTEDTGTNILLFEERDHLTSNLDLKKLSEICDQDDDSQPFSTHRYYCGTLWVYIPYFA